jgi:hypothetical protein
MQAICAPSAAGQLMGGGAGEESLVGKVHAPRRIMPAILCNNSCGVRSSAPKERLTSFGEADTSMH